MEKLEINFTEEKLMNVLDKVIFDENINRYGTETEDLICNVISYIKSNQMDPNVKFTLSDYCTEIGNKAGTYGFKLGFKEGIRLFRTMMNL